MASVTYQDIVSAATNPDDLSRQALVTIFGDVVTNPLSTSAPTLIGSMFGAFNSIIAVLAVVWLCSLVSVMLCVRGIRDRYSAPDAISSAH
ncbi:hypothetical protein I0P38_23680 [Salmonella enterica subsp. enterica]|uniref:hypothetical protein n=1 Tax=Salmonella enterica TaxID=28901 RepID=UPI00283CAEE1|nr:hypothetical protein [Salmonella enterica subsp. enterica]